MEPVVDSLIIFSKSVKVFPPSDTTSSELGAAMTSSSCETELSDNPTTSLGLSASTDCISLDKSKILSLAPASLISAAAID